MDKSPDAFRTISEVADFLETPAHVLRFWESRFPQIKPVKRAGGRRYYRPADVALLAGIRQLLHQDGMTIRGVQKILRDQGVKHVIGLTDPDFASDQDIDDLGAAVLVAEEVPVDGADDAQGGSNVVALTDWLTPVAQPSPQDATRQSADAKAEDSVGQDPTPQPDLTEPAVSDMTPPEATTKPLGASLAAEAGPAAPRESEFDTEATLPPSAPMQWSLFDTIPLDATPSEASTEDVSEPAEDAWEAQAISAEAPDDTSVVQGRAGMPSHPEAALPDGVTPAVDSSSDVVPTDVAQVDVVPVVVATNATVSTEIGLRELPWLPPRLRALQAVENYAPHPDMLPLLARARALHGRLCEAAQARRG